MIRNSCKSNKNITQNDIKLNITKDRNTRDTQPMVRYHQLEISTSLTIDMHKKNRTKRVRKQHKELTDYDKDLDKQNKPRKQFIKMSKQKHSYANTNTNKQSWEKSNKISNNKRNHTNNINKQIHKKKRKEKQKNKIQIKQNTLKHKKENTTSILSCIHFNSIIFNLILFNPITSILILSI